MRVQANTDQKKNKRGVTIPKMIRNSVKLEVIRPLILILHILVVETEIGMIAIEKTKEAISPNQENKLVTSIIISKLMRRSRITINPDHLIKIRTEMDANERPIKV